MIRILSIIASPRKDGNTAALNQSFMEGFKSNCTKEINETIIHPYCLNIRPCIDCKGCYKEGKCLLNDDMNNIYPLLEESDLIVVSTPIYFNTVTAPLKALIDRCQAYWADEYIVGNKEIREKVKVGVILTTAGDIDGTDQYTIPVINAFFKSINTKLNGVLTIKNTDKLNINSNIDGQNQGKDLGIQISKLFNN